MSKIAKQIKPKITCFSFKPEMKGQTFIIKPILYPYINNGQKKLLKEFF
jgi:hypothetical protein